MAQKYYQDVQEMLVSSGMEDTAAATVARLANGFRAQMGMDDGGLAETKIKLGSKKVTVGTTTKNEVKFETGKAPLGAHAMNYAHGVSIVSGYGDDKVKLTLPSIFASAHERFINEAAKAANEASK